VTIKAEYIWIDGTEPTPLLRSKTKVLSQATDLPIWGFDGSSTNQAPGKASDCVLKPVFSCPDPIRGGSHVLVLCEVLIEQEYTMFKGSRPLGFPEHNGYPGPQGPYYCGVGADDVYGRPLVEAHLDACLAAGLSLSGINAEVMPGQWEFQVGPLGPLDVSDQLWVCRWLLHRLGEEYGISVTLDPKPVRGDWNGAGAHTNFSTKAMRESYDAVVKAAEALGKNADEHVAGYGHGIEDRLTGSHETAHYSEFTYGVSDRGASVRSPWQVAADGKGYIEDRRPNANMDPYEVTRLLVSTCCGALA
jgi:glutamine synthetase